MSSPGVRARESCLSDRSDGAGARARVIVAWRTSTLSTRPTLARVDVREGLSQAAEADIVSVAMGPRRPPEGRGGPRRGAGRGKRERLRANVPADQARNMRNTFSAQFPRWTKACLDDEPEIWRPTTAMAATCYDVLRPVRKRSFPISWPRTRTKAASSMPPFWSSSARAPSWTGFGLRAARYLRQSQAIPAA
jgi:hypothetical protein